MCLSAALMLLGVLLPLVAPSSSLQTHYTIGAESLLTSSALIESWVRPLAAHLNVTVGSQLNVTFDVKIFLNRDDLLRAAEAKTVDIVVGNQYVGGCISQLEWRSVAVQKTAFLGQEQAQTAGVMVTLASRADINNVTDIDGRRVASTITPSIEGTLAPWAMARLRGVDLFTAPLPFGILTKPTDPVQALLRGETDIAMLQSGWLELMIASSAGALSMDMFKIVSEEHHLSDDGKPFPFKHSTELLYNHGVYVRSDIDSEPLEAIAQTLYALEPTSPVTAAYGFFTTGWDLPRSQASALSLLEGLNIMRWNGERRQCSLNGLSVFTCPQGSFAHPQAPECHSVSCPEGNVFCICRSCKFSDEFVIRALDATPSMTAQVETVLATSQSGYISSSENAACQRVETCTTAPQQFVYYFEILDFKHYLRSSPPVVTYTVGTGADAQVETAIYVPGVGQYFARISRGHVGTVPISVYADGEHVEQSPFFIQIVERSCTDSRREADADGNCVCGSAYVDINGDCMATRDLALKIAIPLAAVLAICMWLYARRQRRLADMQWLIPFKSLEFTGEELGHGAFGEITKAKLRGTDVAVKKVLRPNADVAAGTSRAGDIGSSRRGFFQKRASGGRGNVSGSRSKSKSSTAIAEKLARRVTARRGNAMSSTNVAAIQAYETTMNNGDDSSYKSVKAMFMKEVRAMVKLRHPCIVTCMGAVVQPGMEPMMVMELMDCSLESLIHNETIELDADILLPMLRDTADGMAYLHEANPPFVHRDLKAANVLVDCNLRAKVADLGLSSALGGCAGSPAWMAPELLNGEPNNTTTDVYAFGIMIAEAFSREAPYQGMDIEEALIAVAVAESQPPVRPAVPLNLPAEVRSLMTECWANDSAVRPTFVQVQHRLADMNIQPIGLSLFARRRDQALQTRVLHDVFPPHIADMLKRGEKVKPERREDVTLYFSDIVGFTDISATLSPAKVSEMLDRLYHRFDALSDKYDIFKVETIGDAYFAAANLVKDQVNHGERMAKFALEAIHAAETTLIDLEEPGRGCIRLRVGMHTGSVVTNVVGSKNARFCLFGDTVNTSSRMESTSIAGHIHCSPEAAAAICAQSLGLRDSIVSRGTILVKGKGEMETFWLRRPGQALNEVAGELIARRESAAAERDERAMQMVESLRAKRRSAQISRGSRGSRDLMSTLGALFGKKSGPSSKRDSAASNGRMAADKRGSTLSTAEHRKGRPSYAAAMAMTGASLDVVVDGFGTTEHPTTSPLAGNVNGGLLMPPRNVNAYSAVVKPVLRLESVHDDCATEDGVQVVVV